MKRLWIVFAALILVLAACNKSGGSGADDGIGPAANAANEAAEDALKRDLEGVWATTRAEGSEGVETVYRLHFENGKFEFMRDLNLFQYTLSDIDTQNQVVVFAVDPAEGTREQVTIAKVFSEKNQETKTGPFTLRITRGLGNFEDLSFVRRLTPQDLSEMADARIRMEKGETWAISGTQGPVTSTPVVVSGGCEEGEYADRLACKDPVVKAAAQRFDELYARATDEYADAEDGLRAARKQIHACSNSECVKKAYTDWAKYVEENYPAKEEGDYR